MKTELLDELAEFQGARRNDLPPEVVAVLSSDALPTSGFLAEWRRLGAEDRALGPVKAIGDAIGGFVHRLAPAVRLAVMTKEIG